MPLLSPGDLVLIEREQPVTDLQLANLDPSQVVGEYWRRGIEAVVLDDQEVASEALLDHRRQLPLQALAVGLDAVRFLHAVGELELISLDDHLGVTFSEPLEREARLALLAQHLDVTLGTRRRPLEARGHVPVVHRLGRSLLDRDVAGAGDLDGVAHRLVGGVVSEVGERVGDLDVRAEVVVLVAGEQVLVGREVLVRLGGDPGLVEVVVAVLGVVGVAHRHEGQRHLLAELHERLVQLDLLGERVGVDLQVQALGEDRLELGDHLLRPLLVPGEHELLERTTEAGGGADEPLAEPGQRLEVHPGASVEALDVRLAGSAPQVAQADLVAGQQEEVPVVVPVLTEVPVAHEVRLDAEDRLHPGRGRRLLEQRVRSAVPVVGDGDGELVERHGPVDHLLRRGEAVERAVVAEEALSDERLGGRGKSNSLHLTKVLDRDDLHRSRVSTSRSTPLPYLRPPITKPHRITLREHAQGRLISSEPERATLTSVRLDSVVGDRVAERLAAPLDLVQHRPRVLGNSELAVMQPPLAIQNPSEIRSITLKTQGNISPGSGPLHELGQPGRLRVPPTVGETDPQVLRGEPATGVRAEPALRAVRLDQRSSGGTGDDPAVLGRRNDRRAVFERDPVTVMHPALGCDHRGRAHLGSAVPALTVLRSKVLIEADKDLPPLDITDLLPHH